jgi:hypothetical protein
MMVLKAYYVTWYYLFEVNEWYCVEDVNDWGNLSTPPFKYIKSCGWNMSSYSCFHDFMLFFCVKLCIEPFM